jgi:hypothetical protein
LLSFEKKTPIFFAKMFGENLLNIILISVPYEFRGENRPKCSGAHFLVNFMHDFYNGPKIWATLVIKTAHCKQSPYRVTLVGGYRVSLLLLSQFLAEFFAKLSK